MADPKTDDQKGLPDTERPIAGDGLTRPDSPGIASKIADEPDPMEADEEPEADRRPKPEAEGGRLPPPPSGDLSM
jgi:hypothetical protein